MNIIAYHPESNTGVEVLDTYTIDGVEMAAVRALHGKPFVGGDRWPVRTEYACLPVSELDQDHPRDYQAWLTSLESVEVEP